MSAEEGSQTEQEIDQRRTIALMAGIFLIAIVPVLASSVLPMIDYYNHLARYYVLAHVADDGFIAQSYAARWGILPNIGLDVIGAALVRWLPPLVVAKLIVLLIFGVQYSGVAFLNRQITGRYSILVALLSVPLLYSFIFTWGFSSFLLGLGLMLWAAGWWLWQRKNLRLAVPVACVLAVLIFLTHGVAFALYGLTVGGLELGIFLSSRTRSLRAFATSLSGLAVQAVVPAMLFLASPTTDVPGGVTNADEAVRQLAATGQLAHRLQELFVYRLLTIVRVSETRSLTLDIISFIVVAAALILLLARRRIVLAGMALPVIGIGVLLVIFVPPAMFSVGYVADRLPLFLAFVGVAALCVRPGWQGLDRVCMAALAVVVVGRLAFITADWQPYGRDLQSLRQVMRAIPGPSIVGYVDATNGERMNDTRRCEMFGPLLTPLKGHVTEVFADGAKQPVAAVGRLKRIEEEAYVPATPDDPKARIRLRFAALARPDGFDYLLTCDAQSLGPAPGGVSLVARAGRFALYRPSPG